MFLALKSFQVGRFKGFVAIHARFGSSSLEDYTKSAFGVFEEQLTRQVADPDATRVKAKEQANVEVMATTCLKASIGKGLKSFPTRYQKMVEMFVVTHEQALGERPERILFNAPSWLGVVIESSRGEHFRFTATQADPLQNLWFETDLSFSAQFLKVFLFKEPEFWFLNGPEGVVIYRMAELLDASRSQWIKSTSHSLFVAQSRGENL